MKFVVDASVAVKWFADEPLFDKARELQQHFLAAPDLILAEVANVMWKLWRKGVLTDAHYAARGEALKDAPLAITPVRDLIASAMQIARELDHPVYDCCYMALAVREGYPAITADRRFAAAAAGIRTSASSSRSSERMVWPFDRSIAQGRRRVAASATSGLGGKLPLGERWGRVG